MFDNSSDSSSTETESRSSARKTLRRFFFVAWKVSPLRTIAQVFFSLLDGCFPIGILWASRGLVNVIAAILTNEVVPSLETTAPWVITLVLLALVQSLTGTCAGYVAWQMQHRIENFQQRALLEAAAHIDFAVFDQPQTYDLIQRSRKALGHRLTNFQLFLTDVGKLSATLVGYGVILWLVDPLLVGIVVLPAIPSAWLKIRAAHKGYTYDYDATPIRRMMGYMLDLLLGPASGQEVRLFGLFDRLFARWKTNHHQWRKEEFGKIWTAMKASVGTTVAELAAYSTAIFILAARIVNEQLTFGDYVVITGAAASFQGTLEQLLRQMESIFRDLPLLRDLHFFLESAEKNRTQAGTDRFPKPLQEGLTVRNLRFRYPVANDDVLQDINFDVRPGEIISIVGVNGAGKSTLIKLLLGLYQPDSGTICYDGVSVASIAPDQFALNCAAVFQDFTRFRRPVREELVPGPSNFQIDDDTLWHILSALGLADRFKTFPRGLDTFLDPSLGEGVELSGGEWQKIALARALVRNPQVLVLDEPTAALDPEAEVELYHQFLELAAGRMTFLISHRIGSARLADRILILDGGRIVEDGTHQELLAKDGLYASFFEAQGRWYQKNSC